MPRTAVLIILFTASSTNLWARTPMMDFLLSFNGQSSSCDKLLVEKTYSDDEKIVRLTLHDLGELGDKEVISGIELKKFKYIEQNTAQAERFSKFQGKRVKEVFTFTKGEDGTFKTVSLIRYKRKLLRYGYSLGGIVCRKSSL